MSFGRALLASALCVVAACSRSDIFDGTAPLLVAAPAGSTAPDDSCTAYGGTLCSGACVDLQSDDANCGACGHACEPGGGCVDGVCGSAACPGGFQACAKGCVDTANDPASCGACGVACPSWDGCAAGKCVPACPFAATSFPASSNTGLEPDLVAAGDFNGDGLPDLAVAGFYGNANQQTLGEIDLLFNQGGGAFAGPATATLPLPENVCGLGAAPFHGGTTIDVAACAYDSPPQIFRNDGGGHFVAGTTLGAAPYPQAMTVADLNGDGLPDLAMVEQDESEVGGPPAALVTLLDQGGGAFATLSLAEDPAAALATTLLAGDVDGDGHLDLVGLTDVSELRVYLGRGDGSFSVLPDVPLPETGRGGAFGDIDGDGRLDLVLALSGGSARVYLGDGSGGFVPGATLPTGPQSMGVVAADFDGDGRLDVGVTDYDGGTLAVFPGLGGGAFGAPALCTTGAYPTGQATADLDGDGKPDVVTVDYFGQVTVLLYRGRP